MIVVGASLDNVDIIVALGRVTRLKIHGSKVAKRYRHLPNLRTGLWVR